MEHRYETIPLTQDDGNDSGESDIETQIDATRLELFPPVLPTPRGMVIKDSETPTTSEVAEEAVWSYIVKRQAKETSRQAPVSSAVVDHEPETNNEQRNSTSSQPEEATMRQPAFSDKTSNESEQSNAPLVDSMLKTRIETYVDSIFTAKLQTQIEVYINEWKSERQSETRSQIIKEI